MTTGNCRTPTAAMIRPKLYPNPWLVIRQDALRLARDLARDFLLDPDNPGDAALLGLPNEGAR